MEKAITAAPAAEATQYIRILPALLFWTWLRKRHTSLCWNMYLVLKTILCY